MWRRLAQPSALARAQQRMCMSTRRPPPPETLSALQQLLGDRLSTAASVLEVS